MSVEIALWDSVTSRVALTSTGVKMTVESVRPTRFSRLSILPYVGLTAGGTLTVQVRKRPTPQSETGATVAHTATFAIPLSGVNDYVGYDLFADFASAVILNPGQELVVDVLAALAAGNADLTLEFESYGLHKEDPTQPYYSRLFDYSA